MPEYDDGTKKGSLYRMSDYERERQIRCFERELGLPIGYFDRNDSYFKPIDPQDVVRRLNMDVRWRRCIAARQKATQIRGDTGLPWEERERSLIELEKECGMARGTLFSKPKEKKE